MLSTVFAKNFAKKRIIFFLSSLFAVAIIGSCSLVDPAIDNPIVQISATINGTSWKAQNVQFEPPRASKALFGFTAADNGSRQVIELFLDSIDTEGIYPLASEGPYQATYSVNGVSYSATSGTVTIRKRHPDIDCSFEFDAANNNGVVLYQIRNGSFTTKFSVK